MSPGYLYLGSYVWMFAVYSLSGTATLDGETSRFIAPAILAFMGPVAVLCLDAAWSLGRAFGGR